MWVPMASSIMWVKTVPWINGIIKPTTDFVRTNGNFPSPDTYTNNSLTAAAAGTTFSDIGNLKTLMEANATNGYTPDFVKVGTDIYSPQQTGISLFLTPV